MSDKVEQRLERLASALEKSEIADYMELQAKPWTLIWRNLLYGVVRGVGIAIGFTFFAATILYVLKLLGGMDLPIVGGFIAGIVDIVQRQLEGQAY